MVILGLGCNLGDRLKQLRLALQLIKKIPNLSVTQVSPLYISDALLPDNAPSEWNMPYLNLAIRCETSLEPLALLKHTKTIEKQVGRQPEKNWGPRVMDIDILAWDNLVLYDEQLHIPHENLHERPFALWPLSDLAPRWVYPLPGSFQGKTAAEMVASWGSRFSGEAPLHTKQIPHRIDTPALVGVLNVTPDSFSERGFRNEILEYAKHLVASGAEILDIGAEATGPHATPIDSKVEWSRLEPVLKALVSSKHDMFIPPKISVDTRHPDVAEKALKLGIDWINDVSGLEDPRMCDLLKDQTCDIVFMHHLGIPVSKQAATLPIKDHPVSHILYWAKTRLDSIEKRGIARERLIMDVGIGFGKTSEQSLALIKDISEFASLGTRILVGHSRKSFLTLFSSMPASDRDIETIATSLHLSTQSVDYLRVHQVDSHARAIKVARALAF